MRWVLPEYIQDALPSEAARSKICAAGCSTCFPGAGYQLVMPPLLEYLDSLLTGAGQDLELRTFKLVDQLSGRTHGRARRHDAAGHRIDAHLLNRQGVSRLCYCGSVLHTLPSSLTATREPLQLGAELYGHAGIEADVEIRACSPRCCAWPGCRRAHRHRPRRPVPCAGRARRLGAGARGGALSIALQAKDVPELRDVLVTSPSRRSACSRCPSSTAASRCSTRRRARLPQDAEIAGPRRAAPLAAAGRPAGQLRSGRPARLPLSQRRRVRRLRRRVAGRAGARRALRRVGEAFGRARPATGFSLDLRELAALPAPVAPPGSGARRRLAPMRRSPPRWPRCAPAGEIVVVELPGHEGTWNEGRLRPATGEAGRSLGFVPLTGRVRKWQRTSSSSAPSGVTKARARSSTG
jgi:ATP phosphoribosyltransferase regulatory subunit